MLACSSLGWLCLHTGHLYNRSTTMQLQTLAATTLHSCCTKKATQRNDKCLFSVFPGSSQPVPFELLGEGALPYPSLLTLQLEHHLGIIIQMMSPGLKGVFPQYTIISTSELKIQHHGEVCKIE